ncbi:carbohydrate ABC transporter permease [Actinocatenispora rupis]|uniref:Sugar ABC transporter permease n=1 Tax=Actinocatenispora rupis TaxID=519421 RepID=A0A8J3J7X2_9ACTN|nr:sugar ABC transporter permease [Actinocatenispora rupis]GID13637.1 sugar ABC transporter permease [Actinocatenispora rupis]
MPVAVAEPAVADPDAGPRLRPRRRRVRDVAVAYLFLGPSLFGVLAFLLAPVVVVAVISLFKWNLLAPPEFVGLANYRRMAGDGNVWHSVAVTVFYVLLTIPTQTILALLLAMLLNTKLRGIRVLRALFVIPWMATPVVMGVVWKWIFDTQNGALDSFLGLFGVDPLNWLGSSALALPSTAAVGVWGGVGYTMLFFLAGLQGIPESLYEAAELDGAGKVQQFFAITLPLLRPTMFFVLVTSIIGSFQVFDTVYAMTKGGPGDATSVLNFTIYQTAFQLFDDGYASALAMLLFGLLLLLTLAQVLYFRKRTTYDYS